MCLLVIVVIPMTTCLTQELRGKGTHEGNCLVIKYSSDLETSESAASCSNTIAMNVCNNFHLPHHLLDFNTSLTDVYYLRRKPAEDSVLAEFSSAFTTSSVI